MPEYSIEDTAALIRQEFIRKKKESSPKGYKFRPGPRNDSKVGWETAAKNCIELEASPAEYVTAAWAGVGRQQGPTANMLWGNAARRWYRSYSKTVQSNDTSQERNAQAQEARVENEMVRHFKETGKVASPKEVQDKIAKNTIDPYRALGLEGFADGLMYAVDRGTVKARTSDGKFTNAVLAQNIWFAFCSFENQYNHAVKRWPNLTREEAAVHHFEHLPVDSRILFAYIHKETEAIKVLIPKYKEFLSTRPDYVLTMKEFGHEALINMTFKLYDTLCTK